MARMVYGIIKALNLYAQYYYIFDFVFDLGDVFIFVLSSTLFWLISHHPKRKFEQVNG